MRKLGMFCGVLSALFTIAGCAGDDSQSASLTVQTRSSNWDTPVGPGRRLDTQRYSIYTTVSGDRMIRSLPGFMEASHRNYLRLTGLPAKQPAKPLEVYMLADRQQWDALTRHRLGRSVPVEAGGYCMQGVGVFWDIGPRATFSVAAHEGFHQFLFFRVQDRLPMWLEEGLCVVAEGYDIDGGVVTFTPQQNVMRFSDLRAALVNRNFMPLPKLLPMHSMEAAQQGVAEKVVGYYGQLWALVRMLRETPRYRAGLERLLADAEAGKFAEALDMSPQQMATLRSNPLEYNRTVSIPLFEHYITSDLAGFQKEYTAFAERIANLR